MPTSDFSRFISKWKWKKCAVVRLIDVAVGCTFDWFRMRRWLIDCDWFNRRGRSASRNQRQQLDLAGPPHLPRCGMRKRRAEATVAFQSTALQSAQIQKRKCKILFKRKKLNKINFEFRFQLCHVVCGCKYLTDIWIVIVQERFSSNCADKRSNRMSGISYSGSEVSVRITTRPQDGGRLTYTAQLCFDTLDSQSSASELIHPPEAPIDSRTFTKSRSTTAAPMRIIANPHFPAVPVHDPAATKEEAVEHERHHEEEVEEVAEETDELLTSDVVIRRMKHSSRPVNRLSEQDTRRYARSWLMAGEAVPRDFNSNSPASPSESSESSVSTGTDPSVIVQDGDSNSPVIGIDISSIHLFIPSPRIVIFVAMLK